MAIDGKTVRRSADKANGKSPIHMVSAWATANGVALGQVKTHERSNEITAIPELLKTLEIKGCISDHRRHGLPEEDSASGRQTGRGLRFWRSRRTSRSCGMTSQDAFEYGERTRFASYGA